MPAVISREPYMPIAKSSRKSSRVTKMAANTPSTKQQGQWIKTFSRENSLEKPSNDNEIKRLEKELAFSCDTLATIVVMIESLQRAYDSRRPDQPMKGLTRLDAAERELLAEYDDLDLQMSHLEKKINKMEAKLSDLKGSRPKAEEDPAPAVMEWDQLQFVPQQSLSPEQAYINDQEAAAIKLEDISDWIDWSIDSF